MIGKGGASNTNLEERFGFALSSLSLILHLNNGLKYSNLF